MKHKHSKKSKDNFFSIPCTCSECKNKTTLDMMIATDYSKSSYHCKDCELKKLNSLDKNTKDELNLLLTQPQIFNNSNQDTKLKKAFIWAFG